MTLVDGILNNVPGGREFDLASNAWKLYSRDIFTDLHGQRSVKYNIYGYFDNMFCIDIGS